MTDRKTYKIEQLAEKVGIGPFGSSIKVETFVDSGIPVISGAHLKGFRLEDGNYNFITEEHANKLINANVKRGDVIFTHAGNISSVAYIPSNSQYERYILSQRQFYLRCNTKLLLPEYITYYFKTPYGQKQLLANSSSVGVPSIAQPVTYLRSIEVSIPDIEEQRNVVEILSSLDDKIELNLQMNQTLEAMAQAIFKEWFVNFNFPGFDGELVDGLPKGWRIVELSSLISVKDGTHDSPKQQQEGKYLITSKHLKNHFIDFSNAYKISDDDFDKVNKRSKVDRLDILITMIGTVGNLYFVHESEIDFAIKNIGLFKASERPDLAYFLYFTIDSKETSEYFTKRLAGSTQQYLTLETLRQTPILLPDDKTLNAFNEYAKTIYERIDLNSQNIQSLTQTRDTLLPKLMSGQLEVV